MVNDVKKRTKTASTSSPTKPPIVTLSKEEIYNNVISFEESEESRFKRDHFKECFNELNKIINDVKALKALKTDDVNHIHTKLHAFYFQFGLTKSTNGVDGEKFVLKISDLTPPTASRLVLPVPKNRKN